MGTDQLDLTADPSKTKFKRYGSVGRQLPLPLGHGGKDIYQKCEGRHDVVEASQNQNGVIFLVSLKMQQKYSLSTP